MHLQSYRSPNLNELMDLIPEHITPGLRNQFEVPIIRFWMYDEQESVYNLINSEDIILIHRGLLQYRKQVMRRLDVPEELLINRLNLKKIIPKIIEIAKIQSIPIFTYVVVWILGDILSAKFEKTNLVVENGGLLLLINQLESPYLLIANLAVQGIGYMVSTTQNGQAALRMNVMQKLMSLILKILKTQQLNDEYLSFGSMHKVEFPTKER